LDKDKWNKGYPKSELDYLPLFSTGLFIKISKMGMGFVVNRKRTIEVIKL
jgi:hypothetical protein